MSSERDSTVSGGRNRSARLLHIIQNKNLTNSNRGDCAMKIYEVETAIEVGDNGRRDDLVNLNLDNAGRADPADESRIDNKTLDMTDPRQANDNTNRNTVQAVKNRNDVVNVDRQLISQMGGLTITEIEVAGGDDNDVKLPLALLLAGNGRVGRPALAPVIGCGRPRREPVEDDEEATTTSDDESDESSGDGSDIQQRGPDMGGRFPKDRFHPYGEANPISPGCSSDSSYRSSSPDMSPPPPPPPPPSYEESCVRSPYLLNTTRLNDGTGSVCTVYPTTTVGANVADVSGCSPTTRVSRQMAGGRLIVSDQQRSFESHPQVVPHSPRFSNSAFDPVSPAFYEEVPPVEDSSQPVVSMVPLPVSFQQARETAELSPYSSAWSASSPSTIDSPPEYPVSPEGSVNEVGYGFPRFAIGSPSSASALSPYSSSGEAAAASPARRDSRETPSAASYPHYVEPTAQQPPPLTQAELLQALDDIAPYLADGFEENAFDEFNFLRDEMPSSAPTPLPSIQEQQWPQGVAKVPLASSSQDGAATSPPPYVPQGGIASSPTAVSQYPTNAPAPTSLACQTMTSQAYAADSSRLAPQPYPSNSSPSTTQHYTNRSSPSMSLVGAGNSPPFMPPAYPVNSPALMSQGHGPNSTPPRGTPVLQQEPLPSLSAISQTTTPVSSTVILLVIPPPPQPTTSRFRNILPKVGATTSPTPARQTVTMSSAAAESHYRSPAQCSLMPPQLANCPYPSARERFRATLNKVVLDDVCRNVDRLLAEELQQPDGQNGDTKLHISTANGNNEWTYAIVERFKNEKLSINQTNKLGQTPLFNAVFNNNPLVVSYLLEHRADPSCRCNDNNTPLHVVAQNGRAFLEVCRILCGVRNISFNGTNSNGYTPLHRAVQEHKPDVDTLPIIEVLLQSGANLDVKDLCSGRTALYIAVERGSLELVQTICRCCQNIPATINFSTFVKDTVLHAAARLNHLGEEQQIAILELLLRHGADRHLRNQQNKYPKDLVDRSHQRTIVEH